MNVGSSAFTGSPSRCDKDRGETWEIKNEYCESGPLSFSYTQHVIELPRTILQAAAKSAIRTRKHPNMKSSAV